MRDSAKQFRLTQIVLVVVFAVLAGAVLLPWVDGLQAQPLDSVSLGSRTNYTVLLPIALTYSTPYTLTQVNFAGSNVTDVVRDPDRSNRVLATVYFGGLYETQDNGVSWTRYQSPTMTMRLNDLDVNSITHTIMYLGTMSSFGVYWSRDGGQTWDYTPGWPYLYPYVLSVAAHPIFSDVVFAGSGSWEPIGGEIYKSSNNGQTWQAVSPQYTNALSFAFHPQSGSVMYAGTRLWGVLKSTDGGDSWYNASTGLSGANVRLLVTNPRAPEQVFAGSDAGLYVSDDQAGEWHPLWQGGSARSLLFDSSDATVAYLGTDVGLFTSYDSGAHWLPYDECGATPPVNRLAFDLSARGNLWIATSDGLWKCSQLLGRTLHVLKE